MNIASEVNRMQMTTRHVLTGQIPPQQQPMCHGQQLSEVSSPHQICSKELWPGYGFWVCVHCYLNLGDMTLGQVHDTPLSHGKQLCKILSRSNMAMKSYGLDTDFRYVCTATLTLEIWPWVKVMTHSESWTTIVWNIIQIQLGTEEFGPDTGSHSEFRISW